MSLTPFGQDPKWNSIRGVQGLPFSHHSLGKPLISLNDAPSLENALLLKF